MSIMRLSFPGSAKVLGIALLCSIPTISFSVSYVTRAEAVMIILSSIETHIPEVQNQGLYPDLIDGQWYVKYMLTGAEMGMIHAETGGLTKPHILVTRAEFLKMVTIAFQLQESSVSGYTDIEAGTWYMPYVGIAYQLNLFQTAETRRLEPGTLVNHFEVSNAIQTILNAYPHLRTTKIPQRKTLDTAETLHPSASPLISAMHNVIDVVSIPPQEQIKLMTTSIVKDAMVRLFRKNAAVSTATTQLLMQSVNVERQKAGLAPLKENTRLTAAAKTHAKDMWQRKYFDHTTPEGVTYVKRIRDTQYITSSKDACRCIRYSNCICTPVFALGENIAQGQLTVQQVMTDWMNSAQHKRNILSPDFKEIGIGLFGSNWVQTFGKVEFFELPGV